MKRSDGITALMAAAVGGHFKVRPKEDSCYGGNYEQGVGLYRDLLGNKALMDYVLGLWYCNWQAVKLLVDKGADISEKDKEGLTALINAAEVRK